MTEKAVIIGAGQAGAQGAQSLRQSGFTGSITLIGEESALPYQRPPLSKAYLKGDEAEERLLLRPSAFYEQQGIALRLGERVTAIDRAAKSLSLKSGETCPYDKLLIAAGAPPRRLQAPGADLLGIYYLRTLKDSDALRDILTIDGRIVIVGAGYIGLEVAAVARSAGRDVTVLEMADRVLARVAGEDVSAFYQTLHQSEGVDLRLGAGLAGFEGDKGAVSAAILSSGEKIPCAAALIGVGAAPDLDFASGLEIENGLVVNNMAQTTDPSIWAAGDCTNFPSARYGRRLRLESVPNAIEQAKAAAVNMAGGESIYDPLPWFWSDQYHVKLQTVGLAQGYDATVARGSPDEIPFSVWYFQNDRLIAVDAMNDPASFAVAKRLLGANAPVTADDVRDARDIKELMKIA